MNIKESKLVIRPAQLRSMSKQVVDGAIDKGSSLRIFKILRAAGKKVKIEKGGESSRTGKKIVIEKSVSQQQQKFMGMVRAVQKGEMDAPSPEVAKAAKTMKKKDVKDFAKTKHKGLPVKKEGKDFFRFRSDTKTKFDEARQMKDPKKDSMVTKGGKTIVIDKSKEKEYLKKGWVLAESITEGALGKQWVNGAKRVKSGSITLVKAKNPDADLHTVMKNGKKVGTFVFDDGPDAFSVTNMSTKKVSWADQIDDIPKMFESVKLDESVELEENTLKAGDKVKTPQGTVEIKTRDTAGMRGKQDKFMMILHMKNGKKASMGSHPAPTASAVTNIAKRFDKGVPSYMAHLKVESVELDNEIDLIEVMVKTGGKEVEVSKMTPSQISQLKKAYGSIEKINVTGPAYKKAKKFIASLSKNELMTLAKAKIRWLSQFAASELRLTHNVKMKASEYMESVEEKRDASKSATGYDIYHKTYSGAMQHAYAHAKKKHGVTVSSDEIDSKVASGPSKPSTGKTVSHILGTNKKKNLHVQVYNTGKSYELNMYVESVEVEEGKWFVRQSAKPNKTGTYQGKKFDDGKKAIAQARKDWKLKDDEHMSAKMMPEKKTFASIRQNNEDKRSD
jgi:hypothetical protein